MDRHKQLAELKVAFAKIPGSTVLSNAIHVLSKELGEPTNLEYFDVEHDPKLYELKQATSVSPEDF